MKLENDARHAHFDCFGGATTSGMLVACLHALPADSNQLVDDVQNSIQMSFPMFQLETLRVSKTRVASMSASVVNIVRKSLSDTNDISIDQMRTMLNSVDTQYISISARDKIQIVLTELKIAESIVHGSSSERQTTVSMNEMIEAVAILLALEKLRVTTVSCGPLPLGEGSIWTEMDGLLPVPSPMTLQLLVGMPTCPGPPTISERDWTTPAAAALLRVLTNVSSPNGMTEKPACFVTTFIGVGADSDECGSRPRVLRLLLGNANDTDEYTPDSIIGNANSSIYTTSDWKMDQLTQLEANLDDMTAEALAFAVERLLDKGALDAWIVPIVMKKGRAAHTLCCLCNSQDSYSLLKVMFRHTTTLGVRIHEHVNRAALRRSFVTVESPFHHDSRIRVKVGYLGEEIVSCKAEFEDCARISRETDVPIQQVGDDAVMRARRQLEESSKVQDSINNR